MNQEDFLGGGGGASASFKDKPVGYSYAGVICAEPKVTQQTDFKTKLPKTWPSTKEPMLQLLVTIQTDLRDSPDDDGKRTVYVKGKSLTDATKDAVRYAGRKALEVGGHFTVTFTGYGTPKGTDDPPKLYSVAYVPPDNQSAGFLGVPAAAGQSAAQAAMPAGVTLTAPPTVTYGASPVLPPAPAGVDPAVWAVQWPTYPPDVQARYLASIQSRPAAPVAAGTFDDEPPF